jgi:hypothetical protein
LGDPKPASGGDSLLPPDRAQRRLPDPIPATYYARPEAPPWAAAPRPGARATSQWFEDFRRRPLWQSIPAAIACLAGVVWIVQAPWRPWLGLLGFLTLATLILVIDAWGVRGRIPLLRSQNVLHRGAGWTVVGGCLVVTAALALLAHGSPPAGHQQAARLSSPPPAAPAAPPGPTSPDSIAPSATPSPTPARTTPKPSTPTSIALLDAPLSAHRRQTVMLSVLTAPNTGCSISVGYPSAPSLDPDTSDRTGHVSWTWRVSNQVPSGSWPIQVSCGDASASTTITVG